MQSKELLVLLAILVSIPLFVVAVKKLIKKTDTISREKIDDWILEQLITLLSKEMNVTAESLRTAIRDDTNELGIKAKSFVEDVVTEFTLLKPSNNVSVNLKIILSNKKSVAIRTEMDWSEIPDPVRSEFIREGKNSTFRDWDWK